MVAHANANHNDADNSPLEASEPNVTLEQQPIPRRSPTRVKPPGYKHPLLLKQSSGWSRAILWTFLGVSAGSVLWACVAQIEEAVPATGKLEPQGTVKEVQVPVNGVVKTVRVKDGQQVKVGDVLLTLDPTTAIAQVKSLQQVKAALSQENQFYAAQLAGTSGAVPTVAISSQMISLSKSRDAIAAESRLFRVQLGDRTASAGLSLDQRDRLNANQLELDTRSTAARLEAEQSERQREETSVKLASARRTLALNQQILNNVAPLAQSGAISQIQLLKQQQEVETNQSEIAQLEQQIRRLRLVTSQAEAKVINTVAVDRKDLTARLAENEKRLAEIDSQIGKAMLENQKRIAETDAQLSQAQQTLKYGELRAPATGIVFDLKANTPGFVATSTEPVLKIVPEDALVAKVSITNQEIGFVHEGMTVDVRVDSFPFSEFGDLKGTLVWIGSDALPPTQMQPYYTFPAKIKLNQQALHVGGRLIALQSGMSLSANIKIRKRTVMSIFTDQFSKASESLKFVR